MLVPEGQIPSKYTAFNFFLVHLRLLNIRRFIRVLIASFCVRELLEGPDKPSFPPCGNMLCMSVGKDAWHRTSIQNITSDLQIEEPQ